MFSSFKMAILSLYFISTPLFADLHVLSLAFFNFAKMLVVLSGLSLSVTNVSYKFSPYHTH